VFDHNTNQKVKLVFCIWIRYTNTKNISQGLRNGNKLPKWLDRGGDEGKPCPNES